MKIKITLVLLAAILVGVGIGFCVGVQSQEDAAVVEVPTPTATPIASASPLQLLCLDSVTLSVSSSDEVTGCTQIQKSLGATAIAAPLQRPFKLNSFLQVRFLAAQAAAKKAGYPLFITSGFRSYEYQATLFKNAVTKYGSEAEASKWVLQPGLSHHPWGLAMDINYPNDPDATKWLEIYGYEYGLCRAYENEWWHFEGLTAPGQPCPPMAPDASSELTP